MTQTVELKLKPSAPERMGNGRTIFIAQVGNSRSFYAGFIGYGDCYLRIFWFPAIIPCDDADKYLSGQPAILYKVELTAIKWKTTKSSVFGMTVLDRDDSKMVHPLEGITTATGKFDKISLAIANPKPKIISKWNFNT